MTKPSEEPQHRLPAVVVGAARAQEERALNLKGKHAFKLPAQADLLVLDHYRPSNDPLVGRLVEAGLLTPGAVLILSPFNTGTYAHEAEAELAFEREKLQLISRLCQLLGAVEVVSDTTTLKIDEQTSKASVSVGKKLGRLVPYKAKADLTLDEREEWRQSLKVHDKYPGGEPDLPAAQEFARYHRISDPEILGLVTARGHINTLSSRRITVVYEGKQDRNLDIAAEVGLPMATATARTRRSHATRKRVSLDLDIRFD